MTHASAISRILKDAGLHRRKYGQTIGYGVRQIAVGAKVSIHDPFKQDAYHRAIAALIDKGYVFTAQRTTNNRAIITVTGKVES